MKLKMFFKWLKQNQFDFFKTLEVTGETTDILVPLLKYYPFLREIMEDQIYMDDEIFYIGNKDERARIDLGIKQKRLVYISGGRGVGKSYYLTKFTGSHDIVSVVPEKMKFSDLYSAVAYESLAGKPKLVVIDSIDKLTVKLASHLKKLAESCRVGCVVVTRLAPKMLKYSERVKVKGKWKTVKKELPGEKIVFKELTQSRKARVLMKMFPNANEPVADKYARIYPLHKCIQMFKYGSTSRSEKRFMRTKDIIANLLMNENRDEVMVMINEQKPNLSTIAIHLADQALNEYNRKILTDYISRHIHNAREEFVYAELVYGLEVQFIPIIVSPITTTRKKWQAKKPKTVSVKKVVKKRAVKKVKKKPVKMKPKRGGLDVWSKG